MRTKTQITSHQNTIITRKQCNNNSKPEHGAHKSFSKIAKGKTALSDKTLSEGFVLHELANIDYDNHNVPDTGYTHYGTYKPL